MMVSPPRLSGWMWSRQNGSGQKLSGQRQYSQSLQARSATIRRSALSARRSGIEVLGETELLHEIVQCHPTDGR